ncbi:hypothetical protein GF367_02955 [Candidatus Woesearchaeota archaeon]|nr:hypothetical protein [Candidatus Woesearchaeota archaeon]
MTTIWKSKKGFMDKFIDFIVALIIFALTVALITIIFLANNDTKQSRLAYEDTMEKVHASRVINDFTDFAKRDWSTGKPIGGPTATLLRHYEEQAQRELIKEQIQEYFGSYYAGYKVLITYDDEYDTIIQYTTNERGGGPVIAATAVPLQDGVAVIRLITFDAARAAAIYPTQVPFK